MLCTYFSLTLWAPLRRSSFSPVGVWVGIDDARYHYTISVSTKSCFFTPVVQRANGLQILLTLWALLKNICTEEKKSIYTCRCVHIISAQSAQSSFLAIFILTAECFFVALFRIERVKNIKIFSILWTLLTHISAHKRRSCSWSADATRAQSKKFIGYIKSYCTPKGLTNKCWIIIACK